MSFLPNDTTLKFPHVFVIPASAGSGKTYTLAHRYVQFLLSGTIPSAGLRNILAITFTKLAAKEMKERIIALLKKAALGESGTVQELQSLVELTQEEIVRRSEQLVQQILRHYSDFNVRTIDSFLTTVFKASAMELGVQPNVELQFDHDAIIGQAFRQYSQNLREGSDEARFIDDLVRLIESNDTGTGGYLWNPFTKIVREVRQLQRQFGRYAQEPVSLEGSGRLQELETRIREQARTLRPMLEASSLPINAHFSKEVERLAAGDVFAVATKGKTKKYFNKFSDDTGAAPELQKLFAVIRPMERDLAEYVTVYAHTYYQPFVQAVKLIGRTIREVKLLDGTVVIDDVNRSLANYLSDDVVPEVYLKLGERIAHFMIDEFQDTSPIQWKNLTPLIEEALAKTGSLFAVGDTKQSIYGFRGADWHIFRDLIDGRYFPSAPAAVLPLTTNYRSAQALVDFVKDVFSVNIAAAGFEEYAKASGLYNFAQEVPPAEQGKGYVDVQLIQKSEEEEEGSDLQRDYVLGTIRDCCARGYSYGDIAILTPANADVVEISSWLNNARIPFLSLSTLDIRKRTVIGEVIALLRFLDSPVDELSFMTFLSGSIMAKNAPVLTRDHIREFAAECRTARTRSLYRAFRDRYPEEWERYFDRLFSLAGYMPIYDIVSEVYKTFRLFERCAEEESALVKLLECVKQFEQQGNNSLKDFLVFSSDEGADAWSIDVPSSVHAVRVMTVHKAKGLGFPVVIVSLREKRPPHSAMVMKETEQGVAVLRVGRTYGERNETLGSIYEEKQREQVIDELNKIYVALTRARKEMYVSVIYKKQENLPAAILPARRYGAPYAAAEKERRPAGLPLVRPLYRTEPVTVPAAKHQRIGVAETHRGDVVHELLSHITFIDGPVQEAVQAAVAALPVRLADEAAAESAAVQDFLAVPEVRIHFERKEGRTVLCEQDIAAKSGRLFRMDRVIIDPDTVTVVDFKTGSDEHHSEYEEQVRNYMAMLQEIYPGRSVQGALLYIDLKKGVPVR